MKITTRATMSRRTADEIRVLTETERKWWGLRVWAANTKEARDQALVRLDGQNYLGGVRKRRDVSSRAYEATAWDCERKTELGVFPSRGKAINALIDERIRVNVEFAAEMQRREEDRHQLWSDMHARLCALTSACNDEMHEPDCQGVRVVKVRGTKLDNAHGEGPDSGERCFLLRNDNTGEEEWLNLSSIIALARKAKLS